MSRSQISLWTLCGVLLSSRAVVSLEAAEVLNCGVVRSARIGAPGESHEYVFFAGDGDVVGLTLTGGGGFFSPTFSVVAPDGTVVLDQVRGHHSRTLQANGPHTVWVYDDNSSDSGTYHLGLEWFGDRICEDYHRELVCGDVIQGQISSSSEFGLYTFQAVAGDLVVLTLAGGNGLFGPKFSLADPNGMLIADTEGAGSHGFEDLVEGTYTIAVFDQHFTERGAYHVGLEWFAGDECAEPLACNSNLSATIAQPAEMDVYSFDGVKGSRVTLELNGGGGLFGPRVSLLSSDGQFFANAVQSGIQSVVLLPEDKSYTIVVFDQHFVNTGAYTIHCRIDEPFVRGDINDNLTISGVSDALALLRFLFIGGGGPLACKDAADIDDDGDLDLSDVVRLLNWAYLGADALMPPAPFSTGDYARDLRGVDPTDDALGCCRVR